MRLIRRVRSWFRLSADEQRLVRHAWLALLRARLMLSFSPYARLRQHLDPAGSDPGRPLNELRRVDVVLTAVRRAAPLVPGASCLTQALAAKRLLRDLGVDSSIRFGVRFGDAGFEAHAWLEAGGWVVLGGGAQLDRYERLHSDTAPDAAERRAGSMDVGETNPEGCT